MIDVDDLTADFATTVPEAVSPVPELIRVAVVGRRRQVELSLPLDVPVALILAELVRLVENAAESDDRPGDVVWVLVDPESDSAVDPGGTLRTAGVAQDDVLLLQGRPTSAAPTLYDDVVDAAARLNQSGHPGWDSAGARCIAYLGMTLCTAAWVCLVALDASSSRLAALLGLTAFVAVTLVVVAAIFSRSVGLPRAGAAHALACLPIAASGCWAGLSPHGVVALSGGACAMAGLSAVCHRLVGAGDAGFVAATVIFSCGAAAFGSRGLGASGFDTAVVLAVAATLATAAVPRLSERWGDSPPAGPDASLPAADDVERRVGTARARRGGVTAGLATVAAVGVTVVLTSRTPTWATLTFAMVCAAALGLPRPAGRASSAWAASGLPAVALVVVAAAVAVRSGGALSVAGASTLIAGAVIASSGSSRRRWRTMLASSSFLAFASILPAAAWVFGADVGWSVG